MDMTNVCNAHTQSKPAKMFLYVKQFMNASHGAPEECSKHLTRQDQKNVNNFTNSVNIIELKKESHQTC